MAWLFVPGLVGSNSGSTSPNPDIELWVSLSGKHEQRPLSWREWRTRRWVKLLSGTTLAPSTADAGVDAWISSLRASRASRSASPDSNGESRTSATCGRTLPGSLARYALRGYCSKTSPVSQQPSLLMDEAPSKPSTTTFASWVTKSRGTSSQRQRWGRHIFASASSLPGDWPTPNTPSGGANTESTATHTGGLDLEGAVALWPTPDAGVRTGFNRSESEGATNRPLLAEAAKMWPTPRAEDSEATGAHRGMPDTLNAAAGHWPSDNWATPTRGIAEKGGHSESALTRQDGKSRMDLLDNQAVYFQPFRPAETTADAGVRSSASTRTLPRRLNPDFVEWLMGWPIGWTVPGSPLPETEWSRWWQHMRGSLSALGWRI